MTIQEKKIAIIEKIQNETSDDVVSIIYHEVLNPDTWDSKYGKNLINLLLEKSLEEANSGKTFSSQEIREETLKRINNRKVAS